MLRARRSGDCLTPLRSAQCIRTHSTFASSFPSLARVLFPPTRLSHLQTAPFILICGLNVLTTASEACRVAEHIATVAQAHRVPTIFKASFDKANRTDHRSFRGPGLDAGLPMLSAAHAASGLPICTDIHEAWHAAAVAPHVATLQIPAMLCRQTDLIRAAARTGRPLHIKKGQFASAAVALAAVEKAAPTHVMLCERGTMHGPNALVVDFAALRALRASAHTRGVPVLLDATHAAQAPPSEDAAHPKSGGCLRAVKALARAGVAVGVDGVFLETHEEPERALVDGKVQVPLRELNALVRQLVRIAEASREDDGEKD